MLPGGLQASVLEVNLLCSVLNDSTGVAAGANPGLSDVRNGKRTDLFFLLCEESPPQTITPVALMC